ncbi:PEP-CTERM sorting domain-containing protein [Verrucomicrobiaceae bacterium N1E253]|uniref:PEP-CTERM sorting domain-containing protein n=1 Tax=Oceaniferula marina TaxID=2748318 RepID=A0A851GRD4_9BACT|nr:PEP-CTERM sorting domain-containing protein [Oceaniferula marina]NWK57567.1 PEP-CTERM sorting domain-containing protein [Oceaniferula marina]
MVRDAGFESDTGGSTGPFPQASAWGGECKLALHTTFPKGGNSALGNNFAFTNPGSADGPATQTISTAYQANTTYTFKGYAVSSGNATDIRFILGYGGGGGFVQLAEQTYDLNGVTAWTEQDGVSFITGASGAELGENIIVRIAAVGLGGNGIWFDAVSLEATAVPEPSAAALLGLGGLALVLRRRK